MRKLFTDDDLLILEKRRTVFSFDGWTMVTQILILPDDDDKHTNNKLTRTPTYNDLHRMYGGRRDEDMIK